MKTLWLLAAQASATELRWGWPEECSGTWSSWDDRDDPTATQDNEALINRGDYGSLCRFARGVEARVVETGATHTHQNVHIDADGFKCINAENTEQCLDYEARVCCKDSHTMTNLNWGTCLSGKWSAWDDRDDPNATQDNELLINRDDYFSLCEKPQAVQARVKETGATQTHQEIIIDENGFNCINDHNTGNCLDYEARICCPEVPEDTVPPVENKWVPIYSQTWQDGFPTNNCKFGDCEFFKDEDNFINFDQLKNLAEYHFKMVIEERSDRPFFDPGRISTLEWKQVGNPLAISNSELRTSDMIWSDGDVSDLPFKGLSLSNRAETLLDGDTHSNWWWFSIGYNKPFKGGQPAFRNNDRSVSLISQKTQLFVENSQIRREKSKCEIKRKAHLAEEAAGNLDPVWIQSGIFIPKCEPNGDYSAEQCNTYTGYCWCYSPVGIMRPGSVQQPGSPKIYCATPKIWHGEADVASYRFIGGYRTWHGDMGALFDDEYGDRNMYHSQTCTEERGIVMTFKEKVIFGDLHIFTRSECDTSCYRYRDVCLYADDVKVGCTPSDLEPQIGGKTLKFKYFKSDRQAETVGKEFKLMWENMEDESCAMVEELFFHYYDFEETEWSPIYSQTGPATFATDNCKFGDCNSSVDENNFINFDQLKTLGEYHFKMVMEEKGTGDISTLEWKQAGNPLAFMNADISPSDIVWSQRSEFSGEAAELTFQGLSLTSNTRTLLEGLPWWRPGWFSIGYNKKYQGGQPVLTNNDHSVELIAQKTQLFVATSQIQKPDIEECSDTTCPACSTCKITPVDTILEFQRSTKDHSTSESPLTLTFMLGGQTVLQETYRNILNSPDHKLRKISLGETGAWDSVRIELGGSDGAALDVFRFIVGEFSLDIVAARGCRYLWIDLPEHSDTECYNDSVFQVETFLLNTDSAANWQRAKCEANDECKCVPGSDEPCTSDKVCSGTDCEFTRLECPENSTMTDKNTCKANDGYKCFPGDDQSCEDDQTCEGVNCLFAIPVVIEDCNDSTCPFCQSCKEEPFETILEHSRSYRDHSHSNNGLIMTFMRGENVLFEETYTDILNVNNYHHQRRNLGNIGAWDNVRIRIDGSDGAGLDYFILQVGGYTLDIVEAQGCGSLWIDECNNCGLPDYSDGKCYYESVFQDKIFYLATDSVESANWRTFQCEATGECGDLNCAVKAADDFSFETSFITYRQDATMKITGSIRGTLMVDHYNLGTFTKTKDGISTFEGGDKCSHGKPRRSEIVWSCGVKNEIISATEPSLCVYSIVGTVVCNPECKDDKFNYDKDPEVILEKRAARLAKFMEDNLSAHSNFVRSVTKTVEKTADRMVRKFNKLNKRCDLWSDPEEDADTARYDEHDPCKAAKQLTKGFVKWSTIYNLNCNGETTNKMLQSVEKNMARVEEKLTKKIGNC